MSLQVEPAQLRLFRTQPLKFSIDVVDGRTGDQWLRSVIGYLHWRSGDCWRRLSLPVQRHSPQRWDYLHALKLVESVRYAPIKAKPAPRIVARPSRTDLIARELGAKPRGWLIDQLMAADPKYTNRKLLIRFKREKLANMLLAATNGKRPVRRVEMPKPHGMERTA